MKEFLNTNKKYIVIFIIGVMIFVLSGSLTTNTIIDNNKEEKFVSVMKKVNGVGELEILTCKDDVGKITGIVVVAEGADNTEIKKQITDGVVAAFNVPAHMVKVFSYKKEVIVN